jgi:glycerol-3-phosphate dehydrogenase
MQLPSHGEAHAAQVVPSEDDRPTHDVIVVGGGVNGTGVARDLALRGLKVVLFEKNDLAFGASGNNSGMIHGGARYLTDHPSVTETSCRDSGYIQGIAPFLLFRIPFLFPMPKRSRGSRVQLAALDAFFAFYDRYVPLKRGKKHTLLRPDELRRLEPGLVGEYAGAVTFDEWGIDGARLCALNVVDACEHGAEAHVHHEVCELLRDPPEQGGAVRGVVARDLLTGARRTATARVVVNATGAWAPLTAGLAGPSRMRLRPGKGIHVVFDRRVSNYAVVAKAIDGRQIFVMPWQNLSWIGTTDDDFFGDLDRVRATTDEVRYLLQGVARVLPEAAQARVIGTTVGVRPTLHRWGVYEDRLSREHEIVDHGVEDGAPNLLSLVGGKLASYRLFAEEAADEVARRLGVDAPGRTHASPLPGGEGEADARVLGERFGVPELTVRRLVYRHGTRAETVLARTSDRAVERQVVCPCEPVLECEVRHVCRHEHARTLSDVARRTRLGLGACGGMRCAHRAAQIVAAEHGLPARSVHRMARDFLTERYLSRLPGLDGVQVRQEELLAARYQAAGGFARPLGEDGEE